MIVTSPLPAARRPPSAAFVRAIFFATPLFVAADVFYGINLRIPFLDALPGAKALYYAVDLGCAIAIAARPRWTATVGLAESMLNMALLVISTFAAYLSMIDSAASPDVLMVNPFTPEKVASLILSMSMLSASYMMRQGTSGGLRAVG
jgi:hypothetical protein